MWYVYVIARYSSTAPQAPATVFRNIMRDLPFIFKPTGFSTTRVLPIARKSHKINTNIPICQHGTCNLGIIYLGIWYQQIHPASWHPISSPTGFAPQFEIPSCHQQQDPKQHCLVFRPSKNIRLKHLQLLGNKKGTCWKWHSNHFKPLCIFKCIYIQIYGLRTSIDIMK